MKRTIPQALCCIRQLRRDTSAFSEGSMDRFADPEYTDEDQFGKYLSECNLPTSVFFSCLEICFQQFIKLVLQLLSQSDSENLKGDKRYNLLGAEHVLEIDKEPLQPPILV